jgi:hypothetical protein
MLDFWKYRALEKMKKDLVDFVVNSEEALLEYNLHIESLSFEIPKELKKLFSYALRFPTFMYMCYNLVIPIDSKEVFTFSTIFYLKNYSFKRKNSHANFSFAKELEEGAIKQPILYVSLKFYVYTNDPSLDQEQVRKIAPFAKVWIEKDKVELVTHDLSFEIDYKVFYI